MKLLFCEDCGDIIAPHRVDRQPRWCRCKRHAVWWEDGQKGILRLWDVIEGPREARDGIWYPRYPRAYVIGLTNYLLGWEGQIGADAVREMIDAHSDFYLFKRWRSLVIRIRPGESSDTAWARLPEGTRPEDGWVDCAKVIAAARAFCSGESDHAALESAVADFYRTLDEIESREAT